MQEDVLFCAENIKIPENLGEVLKEFTKSAIREKPSAEYFNRWATKFGFSIVNFTNEFLFQQLFCCEM